MSVVPLGRHRLYDRIATELAQQLSDWLDLPRSSDKEGMQYSKIIIFAGNGLTRIAAAMADTSALTWRRWINDCLSQAAPSRRLEYLLSLNYSLDEIFSYCLHHAPDKSHDLWKSLWESLACIAPSALHRAIAGVATAIVTTNYDDLFEQAALDINRPFRSLNKLHRQDQFI